MFRNEEEQEKDEPNIPRRARLLLNLVGSKEYLVLKELAFEFGNGAPAPVPYSLQGLIPYLTSKVVTDTINQLFLLAEKEAELARNAMEE